jgi:hypothetical protein
MRQSLEARGQQTPVTKALRHDGIMPSIPGPIMSKWQEEKTERNRRSLARLTRALPRIFPSAVLSRALGRPFVPPTPRLAVDSYWGAHPLRADRLARALAARSGAPSSWTWRLDEDRKNGLPATFRTPPAPYREHASSLGSGFCCVCGQPVYRFGWHVKLWDTGTNKNAVWHSACVVAWQFWTARVITRGFCGACKHGAAPRLGLVFGRTQRLTTASHYSGFGLNTVTFPGLSCSDSGACPTSKSLTVTSTSQNVRAKCGTGARPALGVRVSLIA